MAMTTWREQADEELWEFDPGWAGVWSLLYVTSHAAFTLSLQRPLGSAVDLAFAALDLGEAREELEWARPALAEQRPRRLGPLDPGDDLDDARRVLNSLVAAAVDRVQALEDDDGTDGELETLARILRRLNAASLQLVRAAA
jgi:hypothetical protein